MTDRELLDTSIAAARLGSVVTVVRYLGHVTIDGEHVGTFAERRYTTICEAVLATLAADNATTAWGKRWRA